MVCIHSTVAWSVASIICKNTTGTIMETDIKFNQRYYEEHILEKPLKP